MTSNVQQCYYDLYTEVGLYSELSAALNDVSPDAFQKANAHWLAESQKTYRVTIQLPDPGLFIPKNVPARATTLSFWNHLSMGNNQCSVCGSEGYQMIASFLVVCQKHYDYWFSTNQFPTKIKKLRKDQGLSPGDFAKKIGVKTKYITRWEDTGKPQIRYVTKMTELFKLPLSYFFDD